MKTIQEKIIILWAVFLLGTLFHTQLGLMPLFHGINIATNTPAAKNISEIAGILWGMLAFFAIPMLAIVATAFTKSKRYRMFHFGLTVVYSVLNLLHVIFDLMVKPIVWSQITLMVILFLIGLLLNVVAWQWMKESSRNKRLQTRLTVSET
jgi:hypothetical protein